MPQFHDMDLRGSRQSSLLLVELSALSRSLAQVSDQTLVPSLAYYFDAVVPWNRCVLSSLNQLRQCRQTSNRRVEACNCGAWRHVASASDTT